MHGTASLPVTTFGVPSFFVPSALALLCFETQVQNLEKIRISETQVHEVHGKRTSPSPISTVVSFNRINVASYPNSDDKIKTTSFKVQAGGKTGNALTCAARLRLSLRLISKVAVDTQGRAILQELQADIIDTSFIAAWT
ncbi:hypothetical protein COP2_012680 [Malus domestica]